MSTELIIFIGAFIAAIIGALAAYITTRLTNQNQLRLAELNAKKDIKLQEDRLLEDRLISEVSTERDELTRLHQILSKVALENSQTMSYIQSSSNMKSIQFHERYIENCHRLHEAQAISVIYYPKMSESIRKIYGLSNIFWGNQKALLETDIKANGTRWESSMSEVLKSSDEITDHYRDLQYEISQRGNELNKLMQPTAERGG